MEQCNVSLGSLNHIYSEPTLGSTRHVQTIGPQTQTKISWVIFVGPNASLVRHIKAFHLMASGIICFNLLSSCKLCCQIWLCEMNFKRIWSLFKQWELYFSQSSEIFKWVFVLCSKCHCLKYRENAFEPALRRSLCVLVCVFVLWCACHLIYSSLAKTEILFCSTLFWITVFGC